MAYYRYHVFFCTNQRDANRQCCGQCGASDMRDYLKRRVRELGLAGVRINTSGCLGRCAEGPTIAVYPDSVWYTYADPVDLEEILREHLTYGRIVERLRLPG